MEVLLRKKLGAKGADVTKSWVASISNDDGDIAFEESAVTPNGALTALKSKVGEALRAMDEMILNAER